MIWGFWVRIPVTFYLMLFPYNTTYNTKSGCIVMPCVLYCSLTDLAPGNDEISNETQEKFLTPGNPQEGQVILYKVSLD